MSTLYLEQVGGVSGDMLLATLLDLGLDLAELDTAVRALGLTEFRLERQAVTRHGYDATRLVVHLTAGEAPGVAPSHGHEHAHEHPHAHPHPHEHPHPHPHKHDHPHPPRAHGEPEPPDDHAPAHGHGPGHAHRRYRDIVALIEGSPLSEAVRGRALAVFRRLGEAEASVHRIPLDEVHFHEVGAVDSIVDIVGVCWGLERLGVTRLCTSPFVLGRGRVSMAHGAWPVPAPATLKLLEGFACEFHDLAGETVTPTGAALLTTLADQVGEGLGLVPRRTGAGAGSREWPDRPNILRGILGDAPLSGERVEVLETALDDATPQVISALTRQLLEVGALDVWTTPIGMKKGRTGLLLTVLAVEGQGAGLAERIFLETPTLGIRHRVESRWILGRQRAHVATPWGKVLVKIAHLPGGKQKQSGEFDDCLRVAREAGVPVTEILAAARVGTPLPEPDPEGEAPQLQ